MKDDTISRQAVLKFLYSLPPEESTTKAMLIQSVKQMDVAQPEIIFCKDCKWSDWYDAADGHRYCYCMETGAAGRTADDFCSYAEREEA